MVCLWLFWTIWLPKLLLTVQLCWWFGDIKNPLQLKLTPDLKPREVRQYTYSSLWYGYIWTALAFHMFTNFNHHFAASAHVWHTYIIIMKERYTIFCRALRQINTSKGKKSSSKSNAICWRIQAWCHSLYINVQYSRKPPNFYNWLHRLFEEVWLRWTGYRLGITWTRRESCAREDYVYKTYPGKRYNP